MSSNFIGFSTELWTHVPKFDSNPIPNQPNMTYEPSTAPSTGTRWDPGTAALVQRRVI